MAIENFGEKTTQAPHLSPKEKIILDFIIDYIEKNNYSPSFREITKAVGYKSTSSAKNQIDKLTQKGFLSQGEGKSRTIIPTQMVYDLYAPESTEQTSNQTTSQEARVTILPVMEDVSEDFTYVAEYGDVAAGIPIYADETVESVIALPRELTGFGEFFTLRVVGNSMIDAAICPGDKLVVRVQNNANDGEIVVAMIDGEATVKVLSHSDGHRWLMPRNDSYEPILGDEALILGKVVTVIRGL